MASRRVCDLSPEELKKKRCMEADLLVRLGDAKMDLAATAQKFSDCFNNLSNRFESLVKGRLRQRRNLVALKTENVRIRSHPPRSSMF